MIDPKVNTQPQPKSADASKSSPSKVAMMPDPMPSQDMIRSRAYELYENRGRKPGRDEEDWLRAEQEILNPAL